jgi:ABC-type dipeptide/oligopeptide/nickel transport system ATPase component
MAYFTPLYFDFEGKSISGWGIMTIIGDTTTGKSDTIKHLIKLLKCGQIISGETASIAG